MSELRVAVRAVGAAFVVLLLVGCAPDEPAPADPSPSDPAPTASPVPSGSTGTADAETEQLEQESVEAAEQRLVELTEASADVSQGGYSGWEEMQQYYGNELWQVYAPFYTEKESAGERIDGAPRIVSITETDYAPSEQGNDRVTFDVCTDAGGVQAYGSDGNPIERSDETPERYMAEYVVAHSGPDTLWRIVELTPRPEETC